MKMHMSTCGMGEEDDVDEAEYPTHVTKHMAQQTQQMIDPPKRTVVSTIPRK